MDDINLKGAKGGGGGSGSFTQTPDNLRSEDTFEGVLGLAIGPLKGPVGGMQGIKVNGTSIQNSNGEKNFGDLVAIIGDGDPTKFPQTIALKLGSGASPTSVGLSLGNTSATTPGPWVTRTLTNTGADFIDLRFIAQQLFAQTDKGIFATTATIEVQMKPTGAANWVDPTNNTIAASSQFTKPAYYYSKFYATQNDGYYGDETATPPVFNGGVTAGSISGGTGFRITGKTTQASVHEVRIDVPNTGAYANVQWDIRCRLREKESVDSTDGKDIQRRTIQWESIAGVYASVLGNHEDWRGVAWMQVYGKASTQLTGVPEMTGVWETKIISVPPVAVFNPATRAYTGAIWDGSWSKAYTNDPAWIINDALSDSLSGLSLIAQGSYLNKWDALEVSKWCSQLVPNGAGGTHPRYSINISVAEPQKAEEFIRYLAGAVGGLAWDQGDGEWRLRIDKPETPVDIFTLETIESEFAYSHTDVDTRYNDITMAFKNEEMDFREDRVRLYDNTHIARFGRKPTTMVAVGCTNRQEALRRTKLRLGSTTGETRIVNFSTNRRGRNVNPLDLILVADGDLGDMDNRSTGRTIAVSPDRLTITLRDTVRLEVGVAYTLNFSSPNASYTPETTTQPTVSTWRLPTVAQTRNITNGAGARGNVTVLTLDVALPADIPDNLSISLSATNLTTLPKLYRVLNVIKDESDGERIGIAALEVNTAKWDAADNVTNQDTVFQDLRGVLPAPLPPSTGAILSLRTISPTITSLMGNFERPASGFVSGFRVEYNVNDGQNVVLIEKASQPYFEIVNPTPGTYNVTMRSVDKQGHLSLPLKASFIVTQQLLSAASMAYADGTTIQSLQPATAGATLGANWATNVTTRPANLAVLAGTEGVNNANVSIAANGTIVGAGGGQVTIGGLGFTGDLAATRDFDMIVGNTATATYMTAGNSITKASGTNTFNIAPTYTEGFVTAKNYIRGPSRLAYRTLNGQATICGIGIYYGSSAADLTYAFRTNANTTVDILYYGTAVATNVYAAVGQLGGDDTLEFVYDNVSVKAIISGTVYYTWSNVAPNQAFGAWFLLKAVGTYINSIVWTPYTDNNWASTQGIGRPADYATLGATWGTDLLSRPANLAALAGTEGVNNANLSIAANGSFVGGGGGQVTIGGLGYLGSMTATTNNVTYSATAPTAPVNGDFWGDTSASPTVMKMRVAGVWAVTSNYVTNTNQVTDGANLGVTATWGNVSSRPSNISGLTGSEVLNNNGVSIGSNGVLTGAGGGQVTIGGLTPNGVDDLSDGLTYKRFQLVERTKLTGVETGATLGASWTGNITARPSNLAALTGTEGVNNANISIGANGVLAGAGGGQINALNILNGPVDAGADVTLLVGGSVTVNIPCDYTGVPKASYIPRDAAFTLKNGANTDVTTAASWSAVIKTGAATFTPTPAVPNTTGVLSVSAMSANSVTITMSATYGGKVRTGTLTLNKVLDPAPVVVAGNPGTTVSTSTISGTSLATYSGAQTGILSVVAGTAGQVACTFPDEFYRTTNGGSAAYGKWQWRVVGGTFADVATEIVSYVSAARQSANAGNGYTAVNDPGYLDVNMTKTGLTSGTTYEFQLLLRGSVATGLTHNGAASVVGS